MKTATAPAPSLQAAVRNAISFTARFPFITVRLYEARKAGTPHVLAYEPFVGHMEPEQTRRGFVFTLLGTIKAGKIIS